MTNNTSRLQRIWWALIGKQNPVEDIPTEQLENIKHGINAELCSRYGHEWTDAATIRSSDQVGVNDIPMQKCTRCGVAQPRQYWSGTTNTESSPFETDIDVTMENEYADWVTEPKATVLKEMRELGGRNY